LDRILLIDDDIALTELLAEILRAEGFEVEAVHRAEDGIRKSLDGGYSLLVLDIMLPGMSGFEALMAIRQQSRIPVLMLTARGDPVDRVLGLQIGADDYLPKPFNERELIARIQAILRRTQGETRTQPRLTSRTISSGDLYLDPAAREVRIAGRIADLTTVEFDVLAVLVRNSGEVVSRERLVHEGLGRPFSAFDRSVDNHVSSLRRKLGPGPDGVERIKTVRGVGYIYASSVAAPVISSTGAPDAT
jgi:two-component system response regulator CpxR